MDSKYWKVAGILISVIPVFFTAAFAQTFSTVMSFDNHNGAKPNNALVQGLDGNYYGTTQGGNGFTGGWGYGTVYSLRPDGVLTVIYRFSPNDPHGAVPKAGVIPLLTGDFLGTTCNGGGTGPGLCLSNAGYGTVFSMSPAGQRTTLHAFNGADGAEPNSPLVQAADGNYYGTTSEGGAANGGSIYRITARGAFASLYSFTGLSDGSSPQKLVLGPNGELYGTTTSGGNPLGGSVFKIAPSGVFTTLFHFGKSSGTNPYGGLTLGADGSLYGVTDIGGPKGYGTVFKITAGGRLTVLHAFDGTDGAFATGGLVAASDGNLYGTTSEGGTAAYGTIFRITPSGQFTVLFTFSSPTQQGYQPNGSLLQSTDGNLYGTTWYGGSNNMGVIFKLSTGLPPFIKALPHLASVGDTVDILGTDLTGTTSVTFNGIEAAFTVVSPALVTAIVPGGATSGYIKATVPGGVLMTAGPFSIAP